MEDVTTDKEGQLLGEDDKWTQEKVKNVREPIYEPIGRT